LTLALIPNMYVWLAPSDARLSRNGVARAPRPKQEPLVHEPQPAHN